MFRIERKVNDGAWALLVETEDLFYEDSDISLPNTYYYRSKHVDEEVWSDVVTISPSGYIVEVSHNEGAYTELTQVLTHEVVDTVPVELIATLQEDNSVLLELPTYWPDAQGYIYNEGEHEDMWVDGYSNNINNTFIKEANYLTLTCAGAYDEISVVTDEKVDLTGVNSIRCSVKVYAYSDATTSVDVSNLSGEYFIRLHCRRIPPSEFMGEFLYVDIIASTEKNCFFEEYDAWGVTGDANWEGLEDHSLYIYKVWLE